MSTLSLKRSILDLERIYINSRRRGFLVGIGPKELHRLLVVKEVEGEAV